MLDILHKINKWNTIPNKKALKSKKYHDSLNYFVEKRLYLNEKHKWVRNILGYDFEIIYKRENQIAQHMWYQGMRNIQRVYYVLFQFHNMTR